MNPGTITRSFASSHDFNQSKDAQRGEAGQPAVWPPVEQTLRLKVSGTPTTLYFPSPSPLLSEHRSSRVTRNMPPTKTNVYKLTDATERSPMNDGDNGVRVSSLSA